jgi:uncharacterized membrane-anchored protein
MDILRNAVIGIPPAVTPATKERKPFETISQILQRRLHPDMARKERPGDDGRNTIIRGLIRPDELKRKSLEIQRTAEMRTAAVNALRKLSADFLGQAEKLIRSGAAFDQMGTFQRLTKQFQDAADSLIGE